MNRAVEAEKSAMEARQRKPDFADLYITLGEHSHSNEEFWRAAAGRGRLSETCS